MPFREDAEGHGTRFMITWAAGLPMGDDYLQFRSISKTFPGVAALEDISFGAGEGSIHALIGENGAGKSTLLKVLSGAYRPSGGCLRIGGRDRVFSSTAEAISAGVAVIYQELHLAARMSVAENLYLGHLPNRWGIVDRRRLRELARRQLALVGEEIDPDIPVGRLSIAQRQMVEIAKALTRGAKIIAFDEPTSSLSNREVGKLFAIIRQLKARGHVILYVSHRLEEIFEICDRVTVFRDGRIVDSFPSMAGLSAEKLINRMVGRDIRDIFGYSPRPHGRTALEVRGLRGKGLTGAVSFQVAEGEIVCLFGLVGAGRTELLKLLYGVHRPTGGEVRLFGRPVRIGKPKDAIDRGMVLCPEDRKEEGIFPMRSVGENINISARRHFSAGGFWIRPRRERDHAERHVERLSVKTPSLGQPILYLSGGNQQKVILARWLGEDVKVILLDEPTRGIDVGAKSEIYSIIYDLARRGVAVVMVSSDLPEVLGVSDRVLVMREGRIVASIDRGGAGQEELLALALPEAQAV
jgi:L-arabinose transport system ATP-binding protein